MNEHKLTDQEKEQIAELAADKAYDRFYLAVGKSVTKKLMWIIGAGAAAIWFFLEGDTFK
jgi:hypothetical protein|tara:strand:+ start:154 stop:333 length:180 start_codon:yes stop_codon:yes gene_type:complete